MATQTIILERLDDVCLARIDGILGICGSGESPAEALGDMILRYAEYFPFKIDNRTKPAASSTESL